MTIVAHSHPFVIGVDTHARTHTFAVVVAATGELTATEQFPATDAGLDRAVAWAARRTEGDLATLWVIGGVATYGAHLASAVDRAGYDLVEASRMDARAHRGTGKSDLLDAHRIACSVLALELEQLRRPRSNDGARAALRILLTAREHMTAERTATVNALTALLRVAALGFDARNPLTLKQILEVSRWRARVEDVATATARAEAVRLAKRVVDLTEDLATNQVQMTGLIHQSNAAALMDKTGIGPVTAAVVYAALVIPRPGAFRSSIRIPGRSQSDPRLVRNTTRHRLNRGGDRRLNRALHMAVVVRMTHDSDTRAYIDRRRAEGRTTKEIRRCLKRYLARQLYRNLQSLHAEPDTIPRTA